MGTKQTAIEWLIDEMNNIKGSSISMNGSVQFIEKELNKLFNQAKEMEKEQIINVFNNGYLCHSKTGEQYYNETFLKTE